MYYEASSNGKIVRAGGPEDAERRVLCLPGGLSTAAFYDDVLGQPAIAAGNARLVATTLPGFGGVPAPDGFDFSVESYARLGAELARDLGCDTVMGHSFGANVAIEMAAGGHFDGRLILLSPSFSREDEVSALGFFNRLSYVPGLRSVLWAILFRSFPKMLKGTASEERVAQLAAEMASNDRTHQRLILRRSFEYLDEYGTVAGRLCNSGAEADVVFGDHDEIGLTAAERAVLEACPNVRLHVTPDSGHMILTEQPGWVAELIAAGKPASGEVSARVQG